MTQKKVLKRFLSVMLHVLVLGLWVSGEQDRPSVTGSGVRSPAQRAHADVSLAKIAPVNVSDI